MRNILSFHKKIGWKPGDNTIAYRPLTSSTTVNDMSGKGNTLTNYNSVAFGTYAGVNCASFSGGSSGGYLRRDNSSLLTGNQKFTFCERFYRTGTGDITFVGYGNPAGYNAFLLYVENDKFRMGGWDADIITTTTCPTGSWHLIAYTFNGTTARGYLDGVEFCNKTFTYNLQSGYLCVGKSPNLSSTRPMRGYLSEVIFEDKARTAQEVADYYNQTKSAYIEDGYEYNYDFRGKTKAQVLSDGWANLPGDSGNDCGANGLYLSNGINGRLGRNVPFSMADANKITFEVGFYIDNSSFNGGTFGIAGSSDRTNGTTVYTHRTASQVVANGDRVIGTFAMGLGVGTYSYKCIYDLVAKTVSLTYSNGTTKSGTLTDAEISGIRSISDLWFGVFLIEYAFYMQTVKLTIE